MNLKFKLRNLILISCDQSECTKIKDGHNIKFCLHCKFLILIMRKKELKTGKNLLVLSKNLLVTIAGT